MKYALIIGNNKYDDPKLAQLKTPAADSQALAKILGDKTVGSFDEVTPLINQTETRVRRAISAFLTNKKPDDLILLYFSGHGVLDDRGRLYLALRDTQFNLLKATSIPSSFLADEMDSCRSKRQILILDCCHSGAFARGTKGPGQKAITETTFEGSGFGRVVLTASDSTQYALEGDQVIKQTELSLFTHFLLDGLKTGEADMNNDGHVALDEWYDYTYAKVISETPRQVPHKWSYNQQGDLIIARNPFVKKKVVELPHELVQALDSSFVGIRESAVNELGKYLNSRDPEMVTLAISSLKKMREDDSRRISSLAEKLLSEFEQARTPGVPSKATAPIAIPEIEPETINMAADRPVSSLQMKPETAPLSPTGTQLSKPKFEKIDIPVDRPSLSQDLVFDSLFWLKWSGTALLGVIFLIILYNYSFNNLNWFFAVPFCIVTGLASLAQWWGFRNRLESWWIVANVATGAVLGGMYYSFYISDSWSGYDTFWYFSVPWIIGNVILGFILLRGTQEKSKDRSSSFAMKSVSELIESDPRQNIFITLLPIFLVLRAFYSFIHASGESGLLSIPDWLQYGGWILTGIASILVGVFTILKKELSGNFGFIAFAIFAVLNGIIAALDALSSDFQTHFYTVPGVMALLAGMFFVSQRETWKHLRYMMLSGFLIFVSLVYFGLDEVNGTYIFSIISAIFALLAGIFFFLRK